MSIRNALTYILNYKKLKKIKLIISDVDGVLTDGKIHIDDNGVETKVFNVYDGISIKTFMLSGGKFAVLSASPSKSIAHRFAKLAVADVIFNMEKKTDGIKNLLSKYSLGIDEVLYIGDDLVDVSPMKYVCLSFAPKTAVSEAKNAATSVLSQKGGEGVVREAINMVLKAKGVYSEVIKHYTEYK